MVSKTLEASYQLSLNNGKTNDEIELHMVGGFMDNRSLSQEMILSLLDTLLRHKSIIVIKTAAVCQYNNCVKEGVNRPIIYNVAFCIKTCELFKCQFVDKGPLLDLRSSRHFCSGHNCHLMLNIYDTINCCIRIEPFDYDPMRSIDYWLKSDDEFILRNLSTSPDVEPEDFVSNVRRTLQFIRDHPFPSHTVFKDRKSMIFRKDQTTGVWIRS